MSALSLPEELEVSLAAHSSSSKIVLDDEHRDFIPFGNDYRPFEAVLNVNHVIALGSVVDPSVKLKDLDKSVVGVILSGNTINVRECDDC